MGNGQVAERKDKQKRIRNCGEYICVSSICFFIGLCIFGILEAILT